MVRKSFTFDGKRYYVKAKTEAECLQKIGRKKLELEQGIRTYSTAMPVRQWAERWLATYKGSVSEETRKQYVYCLNIHIYPAIGTLPLKSVRPIHLQQILQSQEGFSSDHIDKVHYTIRQIFSTAYDNDLLKSDPSEKLQKPKGRTGTHRALTEDERKHILNLCKTHRAGLWVLIMLFCGLRPAEAAALQWRHIDFKKGTLKVEQAIKRSGGIGKPKTKDGIRVIPIALPLLSRLEAERGEPFDFVLKNTRGGRLTSTSMQRMWEYFKRDLNIEMGCRAFRGQPIPPLRVAEDLVPYCFRHTFCTDLQAAGVPINVARELMGHSDISLTAKIYTHSSEKALENARNAMNGYWEKEHSGQLVSAEV